MPYAKNYDKSEMISYSWRVCKLFVIMTDLCQQYWWPTKRWDRAIFRYQLYGDSEKRWVSQFIFNKQKNTFVENTAFGVGEELLVWSLGKVSLSRLGKELE